MISIDKFDKVNILNAFIPEAMNFNIVLLFVKMYDKYMYVWVWNYSLSIVDLGNLPQISEITKTGLYQ